MKALAAAPLEGAIPLGDAEFERFQALLRGLAGIALSESKKALVCSRLGRRLDQLALDSYAEYLDLITSGKAPEELQKAIDLLTTNETYFFREPKHFDFVRERLLAGGARRAPFRAWSAACSTGEEPYSLAMVLADRLGQSAWEVTASDLSARVLDHAQAGRYAMEDAATIPDPYLRRYCLKGIGSQEGSFLIDRQIRARVAFRQINLNAPLPAVGSFDLIFLRNVMIYFDAAVKRQVLERLVPALKPGGHLVIGHAESLHGVCDAVQAVAPAIFRKR